MMDTKIKATKDGLTIKEDTLLVVVRDSNGHEIERSTGPMSEALPLLTANGMDDVRTKIEVMGMKEVTETFGPHVATFTVVS